MVCFLIEEYFQWHTHPTFLSSAYLANLAVLLLEEKKGRRSKCPSDTLRASPSLRPSRTVSGWEEPFVIPNSITDLWVVPETILTVTWIKHQHISASHWNSKSPSGGTITTDRCLTHIRDAAHSERICQCTSQNQWEKKRGKGYFSWEGSPLYRHSTLKSRRMLSFNFAPKVSTQAGQPQENRPRAIEWGLSGKEWLFSREFY